MIVTVTANPSLDVEYLVERLATGSVLIAEERREDAGGKGINVARALARLGVPVRAVALLGGGAGERVADLVRTEPGVELVRVAIAAGTRTNVVVRDAHEQLKVNERGPRVAADEFDALEAAVVAAVPPGAWCVIAGSLPPGVAPERVARLVTAVRAAGGHVALDASGAALAAGAAAGPALAKPNRAEALELVGAPADGPVDVRGLLDALLARGIERVLLSLGADGAAWADGDLRLVAAAPRVVVASDVGAGDAMLAAAVAVLAGGGGPEEALRRAVAAGSVAASLPGTDAGSAEAVDALTASVTVLPLG